MKRRGTFRIAARRAVSWFALALIVTITLVGIPACRPTGQPNSDAQSAPAVTVSETRQRLSPERGKAATEGPALAAADGAVVLAGFGQVDVEIALPSGLAPETVEAAITTVPAADVFTADSRTVIASWPGTTIAGMPLPDPAALLASGVAPAGYSLEMSLTIDAAKAPAFASLAGSDGVWTVTVRRRQPPDFAASCPGNPALEFPYPDPGDPVLHYVSPAMSRLRFTFTKPMNRVSVEAVLRGNLALVASEFSWKDDQTLEVRLGPSGETPPGATAQWAPQVDFNGALDQDGMALWFGDSLVFFWGHETQVLARVPVDRPSDPAPAGSAGAPPVILTCDAGFKLVSWSPGGSYLLAQQVRPPRRLSWLEVAARDEGGDFVPGQGPAVVYRAATGDWWQPPSDLRLFIQGVWLDDQRLFLSSGAAGWQVLNCASGKIVTDVLDQSGRYFCEITPGPDQVAVFQPQGSERGPTDSRSPADLVLFDLEGKEAKRWIGRTYALWTEMWPAAPPLAWLPGGQRLVFGEGGADGNLHLAVLDLADGKVTPLPDSDKPFGGPAFTAPSGAVCYATGLGSYAEGARTVQFGVFDLDARKRLWSRSLYDIGLNYLDGCLVSPDGRYLALVQTARGQEVPALTIVVDAANGQTLAGYPIRGEAIGFAADGKEIYVTGPAD